MDRKKTKKAVSYFFGLVALTACEAIVRVLPARWLYGFAARLGRLGFRLAHKQRRIALESLKIAFGADLQQTQCLRIARDCFILMAKSSVELFFLMDRPQLVRERVRFQNQSVLQEALARGRGVILVSAHFGNFPLLLARLSLEGYPTAGIMRPMRDERVEKLFLQKREKFNIRTIYSQPRKACVDQTIDALRKNGIVFIPLDQNFGTAGVFVDFFGRKAATATGPVVLAQRTKAAVLPCFIIRQPDDTLRIVFEPALELLQAATPEETIVANVQQLTRTIEEYIRRYPAEWGWIHRRWKSRPSA